MLLSSGGAEEVAERDQRSTIRLWPTPSIGLKLQEFWAMNERGDETLITQLRVERRPSSDVPTDVKSG